MGSPAALVKHEGPGPHPGTGSSQDVHGGGGGGESTGVSAYDDPEGFLKDPANAVLPNDMVNELDGGPGASIQYHGSSGFIPVNGKFKDPETYITPQADEANGYAFGMHRMQSNPNGYRITVRRKPGKTLNMSDAIMEGFDAGVEPDEIIARLAPAARAAGFRYLYHDHPSFGSNEVQYAVISLYPNEDLKILNSKKVYNKSLPAGDLAKHDGPGEHESGSPQSVHGGGGGKDKKTKWTTAQGDEVELVDRFSDGLKNGRLSISVRGKNKGAVLFSSASYDHEWMVLTAFPDDDIGNYVRLYTYPGALTAHLSYAGPHQDEVGAWDNVFNAVKIMRNKGVSPSTRYRIARYGGSDHTGTIEELFKSLPAGSLAKAAPALPPGFWEEEMRRLAIILIPRLTSLVLEGMRSGTVKVGIGFNYAIYSVLAAQWAQDYTDQLLQQVRTTNESVVGDILARWIATPGRTIGDLRAALTPHFGVRRADTIAITEATRALASGEIMAFQRAGIEEIRWGTNNDELVCPHCGPLHGLVRKIGEVFGYFKWRKGAAPEPVFAPPFHPNCRCGISPVVKLRRSAWGDVPNSLIIAATLAMIRPGGWDYAKGDFEGHPFRGNQWVDGAGSGGVKVQARDIGSATARAESDGSISVNPEKWRELSDISRNSVMAHEIIHQTVEDYILNNNDEWDLAVDFLKMETNSKGMHLFIGGNTRIGEAISDAVSAYVIGDHFGREPEADWRGWADGVITRAGYSKKKLEAMTVEALDLANQLTKSLRAGDLAKHDGPGPHSGTGSPQDVHGGGEEGAGAKTLHDIKNGKNEGDALGSIEVLVFRTGDLVGKDNRGIFFAAENENAEQYVSLHGDDPVKSYKVKTKNTVFEKSQHSLYEKLYGKRLDVNDIDISKKFNSTPRALRWAEARMARTLQARGFDSVIFSSAFGHVELWLLPKHKAIVEEI